ncbi:MAG TPA: hydrolase [Desulfosporosinus sp.]|jgi:beta-lactamase superfamily II metal-dependent hydrolase|nr:hydrolase [Desulfosporosinus sp.]
MIKREFNTLLLRKWSVLSLLILSFLLLSGCGRAGDALTPTIALNQTDKSALLQVHFINVGQADSILVIAPNGQTILIDGGNTEDGPGVVNYLKSQGVKELTAIVATHPHEDHIGGLDTVIHSFPPKQVYMANGTSTTKTFEDFITAVNASGAKKIRVKAGVKLDVPGIEGLFLAPNSDQYDDLNNFSAVLKITFGKVSFLLTGDAEKVSEAEMLKSGQDLQATVLRVGHHGSSSSTTGEFLKAVSPKYAVISVGVHNDYGHPTQGTLNTLTKAGVQVYRTDQEGTIVATSDGQTVKLEKTGKTIASNLPPIMTSISSSTPKPVEPVPAIATDSVMITTIDLSGEVVTLTNSSSEVVNLTGWKLVSEKGNQTFYFPEGTTIPGGGALKVLSGKNALAGPNVLVWTVENIWNNEGDPGALYNAQGQLVARK